MEVYQEMLCTGCKRSVITYTHSLLFNTFRTARTAMTPPAGDGGVPGDVAHRLRAQRHHLLGAHQRLREGGAMAAGAEPVCGDAAGALLFVFASRAQVALQCLLRNAVHMLCPVACWLAIIVVQAECTGLWLLPLLHTVLLSMLRQLLSDL
mgnify:CR=1 FL=1